MLATDQKSLDDWLLQGSEDDSVKPPGAGTQGTKGQRNSDILSFL